jgi:hypothetical protein
MRRFRSFLFFAGLSAVLVACSGTHESGKDRVALTEEAPATEPVVDVPAIVGAPIDKLLQRLGPARPVPAGVTGPITMPALPPGEQDSTVMFRSRGLELVATFNPHSRRVSDLLLLGADEDALMRRANLRMGAAQYLILPVFHQQNSARLLGLRVVATAY